MNCELEKNRHISFCGSYCHICDWFTGKVRRTAQAALDMMERYSGFKNVFEKEGVDEENIIRGLKALSVSNICPSCKAEVGRFKELSQDRCKIRQCCSNKGYSLCNECKEFPCKTLDSSPGVAKFHCIENLRETRDKGLKQWIDKQWREHTKSA